MAKQVGIVIGRFQVPVLHAGHLALLRHVIANSDETCVLVGVTPKQDLKNPLPYPAVECMIRGTFHKEQAQGRLQIHPLPDIPGNDLQWSHAIDQLLGALYPYEQIKLWSGRDSFKPYYHGKHRPVRDWYGFNGEVNGTKERDEIIQGAPSDSLLFRQGIIYGVGQLLTQKPKRKPRIAVTVSTTELNPHFSFCRVAMCPKFANRDGYCEDHE